MDDWMIVALVFLIGFALGTFVRMIIDFIINLMRKRQEREQVGEADFKKQYMTLVAQIAAQQPQQNVEVPQQMQPLAQQPVQPTQPLQTPQRLSKGIYFVNDAGELTKVERKGKKK